MQAVVHAGDAPGGMALREIDRPALTEERLIVRVRAASLNALDWHMSHGLPRLIGTLMGNAKSSVRGVDLAGVVEAVGAKATRFQVGDEVFGVGFGSCAQYAATTEERLASKPRSLSFAQAAALPVAGCTALQGLRDHGELKAGQRVLVYGAGGGVGTLTVQVAKALGAHVTAVSRAENLEMLRALGADEVIDYAKEDFTRRAERWDLLYDVGSDRSDADCRRVLAPGGCMVLAGAPSGTLAMMGGLLESLLSSGRGRRRPFLARIRTADLGALKDLAEAGKLTPVIDREVPLSGVPEAIRYLGTRQARGKIVVRVD